MADQSLFPRLRRLFSTDVVIRNVGGTNLKVMDINKIQQSGELVNNSLPAKFKKLYTGGGTSLLGQHQGYNFKTMRPKLYSKYDAMDQEAIVASALDIIAAEATLKDDFGDVLTIKSPDDNVQRVLQNLFYDVLNIEFNLYPWVRMLCKYGDFFLKLEISEKFGVYNVIPYTAYHIERIEGYDDEGNLIVRFMFYADGLPTGTPSYNLPTNEPQPHFEAHEMAHFRLLDDMNLLPHGRSYLEPARKEYEQYIMMKDAMLIHRIVRAPEKRIFYMNVGGIPPNEVDAFMEKTVSKMKRVPYVDPQTGAYNLKYNIDNLLEDFYVPRRGNDTATEIQNTKGLDWAGIEDVEYLRKELFAALKIPPAFMGYDETTEGKATLAAQDVHFAKIVERIQRIMVSELYKIAIIHLYAQGFKEDSLVNFELELTTPSIIYDQERTQLLKEKVELAVSILENNILPSDFVLEEIFRLSENQIDEFRDLIIEDQKRKFRIQQISEEGNDPNVTGRSYGTPHDLASLYGLERYQDHSVPDGYDKDLKLGRPEEKTSDKDTQEDNFGKDRLGKEGMKKDPHETEKSQLRLENTARYLSLINTLKNKNISKSLLTEQLEFDFLNESNLTDEEE